MTQPSDTDQPRHDVAELRRHLFETLQALRDKDAPMDIARARAVSEVAQVIIDSARVEVDAARVIKQAPSSGFLQLPAAPPPGGAGSAAGAGQSGAPPQSDGQPVFTDLDKRLKGTPPMPANGITGVTRHLTRG